MSRDGLPLFLNKLLCPLLNRAAERYSEIFIDKEIQVLFDIDDGHIVPRIMNTHGGKSIASQSAGEKAWAGIITAFALREIANPTNLLVLDEPGTGLDTESAKMFGRRLRRLRDRFETILVVSHNDSICSALQGDSTVTVVKKNNVSKLK
jgi:DNA repair exonuclease SbcCD ATPase subunit